MSGKTEQQLQNLREALVWWATVPEANVYPNLGWFSKGRSEEEYLGTDCNTVACFGGWCARWPALRAQGVFLSKSGAPRMQGLGAAPFVADRLFGDASLFDSRMGHQADWDFAGSDHSLVTNRIRWALEH